ncbi:MAG: hypothetical protein ACFFF4_13980 [Candidatus Thorarchaeota archaeon]
MTLDSSEVDTEAGYTILENIGRFVSGELMSSQFEVYVRSMPLAGIIDVTHWTPEAIRVLLTVCRDRMNVIGLHAGRKYFTPIIHQDGPLFDMLIQVILDASRETS